MANANHEREAAEGETTCTSLARKGSTGPRTSQGKAKSRYNALKKGFFAKVVLVQGESASEYEALLNGLCEDWQPQGTEEKLYVEELAALFWRKRRLLQVEAATAREAESYVIDCVRAIVFEAKNLEQDRKVLVEVLHPDVLYRAIEILRTSQEVDERLLRREVHFSREIDRIVGRLERRRMRLGQASPSQKLAHSAD
jgi:hypothetical protein